MSRSVRPVLRLLFLEAAFGMAYETWVGPTYVSGLAGEVGVSIGLMSLLAAVPWIGTGGQLLGAWAFERVTSVKRYTITVASVSRSLWALPLGLAAYWAWRERSGGGPFPTGTWFSVVAPVACLAALLSGSGAVAWLSWVKGLVPGSFQGRFLGGRQRAVMGALIAANLVGAALVAWRPGGYRLGYGLLCATGLLCAFLSSWLLSRIPDLAAIPRAKRSFGESVLAPLRDRKFRRVVLFAASFNGAIQLAGPYFPYYFTKELGIGMSSIALWAMLNNLGAFLAAGFWGGRLDRVGGARTIILVCSLSIACSPLFYLSGNAELIRWIGGADYLVNGMAWSGFSLSMTTLAIRACPPGRNTAYFSVYSACNGLAGATAALLGGWLAQRLEPWGGFRALWLVAAGLRFSVLLALFGTLRPLWLRGRRAEP